MQPQRIADGYVQQIQSRTERLLASSEASSPVRASLLQGSEHNSQNLDMREITFFLQLLQLLEILGICEVRLFSSYCAHTEAPSAFQLVQINLRNAASRAFHRMQHQG